jgi:hypothetical protein
MIYDLDTLEQDFLYPMIKTIVALPDVSAEDKAQAVTEAVMSVVIQDREAHASSQ